MLKKMPSSSSFPLTVFSCLMVRKIFNWLFIHQGPILMSIWGYPHSLMIKAKVGGIVISEFELHLCYYIHFRTNTLGKGMNPLILLAMG